MEDIRLIKGFVSQYTTPIFDELKNNIKWNEYLNVVDSDEKVKIMRKMAYISNYPTEYKYAKLSFIGDSWDNSPKILKVLCDMISKELDYEFNSVLLNYYKDGKDEIKWHSDKEDTLGKNPIIACLNFGATRKFWFLRKLPNSEKFYHEVENGDLLIMGSECQEKYLHAILKEKEVTEPRISLTFRKNL